VEVDVSQIDDKFFRKVVGARIRLWRILRGHTMQSLEGATGIEASMLCRIEGGTLRLDTVNAVRLSDALNLGIDELLAVPEEPEHAAAM